MDTQCLHLSQITEINIRFKLMILFVLTVLSVMTGTPSLVEASTGCSFMQNLDDSQNRILGYEEDKYGAGPGHFIFGTRERQITI